MGRCQLRLWGRRGKPGPSLGEVRLGWSAEKGCYVKRAFVPSMLFALDPNWVVAMMFIVIIGGIGTLEGPILGVVIYFALRELLTVAFGLTGGGT